MHSATGIYSRPGSPFADQVRANVEDHFGFRLGHFGHDLGLMFVLGLGFRLLCYLILRRRARSLR